MVFESFFSELVSYRCIMEKIVHKDRVKSSNIPNPLEMKGTGETLRGGLGLHCSVMPS